MQDVIVWASIEVRKEANRKEDVQHVLRCNAMRGEFFEQDNIESVNRRTTIADSPYTHLDTAS